MEDKLRILLCEDDENLGTLTREYLEDKGFKAEPVTRLSSRASMISACST